MLNRVTLIEAMGLPFVILDFQHMWPRRIELLLLHYTAADEDGVYIPSG